MAVSICPETGGQVTHIYCHSRPPAPLNPATLFAHLSPSQGGGDPPPHQGLAVICPASPSTAEPASIPARTGGRLFWQELEGAIPSPRPSGPGPALLCSSPPSLGHILLLHCFLPYMSLGAVLALGLCLIPTLGAGSPPGWPPGAHFPSLPLCTQWACSGSQCETQPL